MHLKRYAHACFGLEDALGRTWLFDPYRPDGLNGRFSLPVIRVRPHVILCTHAHEDHAWREQGWGECPFWETDTVRDEATLTTMAVPHDNSHGIRMGFSRALRLRLEGPAATPPVTVVHVGDVGPGEGDSLVAFCKGADLLMLPAGGNFTLGPEEAEDLARKSQAPFAVLMHFREPGIDLDMYTPEEAFARLTSPVKRIGSSELHFEGGQRTEKTQLLWLAPHAPAKKKGS